MERTFNSHIEDMVETKLLQSEKNYHQSLKNDTAVLSSSLSVLVENEQIQKLFLKNDREALYLGVHPLFEKLRTKYDITHWYFITVEGKVFLRVHDKTLFDDTITRQTFRNAKRTNKESSGMELGKTAFALRVVSPYYINGKLAGYMELGKETDHFLTAIQNGEKDQSAIIVEKEFLKKADWESVRKVSELPDTWNDLPDDVLVASTEGIKGNRCFDKDIINNTKKGIRLIPTLIDDLDYGCDGFEIKDPSNRRMGSYLSAVYFGAGKEEVWKEIKTSLFHILSLVFVIFCLGLYFTRSFTRSIEQLSLAAKEISGGNTDKRAEVFSHDEIGDLARSFNMMVDKVENEKNTLEKKVEERTEYYARVNKMMIEREGEMIEIKKRLKEKEEEDNANVIS